MPGSAIDRIWFQVSGVGSQWMVSGVSVQGELRFQVSGKY
ncbi:hypothetical protein D3OALGA1CA_3306 [Olavius algarvensis associated proteobacterium Delta 3]|nr:hypothetical protein D3OALGA1CA_3306 [Olavius algarvensis associated proteobacterium Delta 3]